MLGTSCRKQKSHSSRSSLCVSFIFSVAVDPSTRFPSPISQLTPWFAASPVRSPCLSAYSATWLSLGSLAAIHGSLPALQNRTKRKNKRAAFLKPSYLRREGQWCHIIRTAPSFVARAFTREEHQNTQHTNYIYLKQKPTSNGIYTCFFPTYSYLCISRDSLFPP